MEGFDPSVVQRLCEENAHFLRLYEEHRLLEKELDKLSRKAVLSAEDALDKKRAQKLKLAGKDEMARMVEEYTRH